MQGFDDQQAASEKRKREDPTARDADAQTGGGRYRLTVGLTVLDHLSDGLYSSVAAVLTEAVANAWDADATEVRICLDVDNDSIVIRDNGCGMDRAAVNDRFLMIGYRKRDSEGTTSPGRNRPVMGRKGIGKLSLFSIADVIEVETCTRGGETEAFRIDMQKVRKRLRDDPQITYEPEPIEPSESRENRHGTLLRLSRLRRARLREVSPESLRRRLARRFSVIGSAEFQVIINDTPVKPEDRRDLALAEYLWIIEDTPAPVGGWTVSDDRRFPLPNRLDDWHDGRVARGWLATADRPRSLGTPEGNLNSIVVLARGRLVLEDILPYVGRGELFTKYITGQIEADFLDDDDEHDIITSDRQRLLEEDERFGAVKKLLKAHLSAIEKEWSKLRTQGKRRQVLDRYPKLGRWLERLDKGWRRQAETLIGRVAAMDFEDDQDRMSIMRAAVLGFERLRLRGEGQELERALGAGPEAILRLLSQRDDFEAALYRDIVTNRLEVIRELENHVAANELERVLQEYLFDHLWLLDPAWERATGSKAMEERLRLRDEFKDDDTTKEKFGRVDIRYRTVAGKHVIVELKRANVKRSIYELGEQGEKYVNGLRDALEPAERNSAQIEVIFVVGNMPCHEHNTIERVLESVAPGSRIITYDTLATRAKQSYNEFLESCQKAGEIEDLFEEDGANQAVSVS